MIAAHMFQNSFGWLSFGWCLNFFFQCNTDSTPHGMAHTRIRRSRARSATPKLSARPLAGRPGCVLVWRPAAEPALRPQRCEEEDYDDPILNP
jgi:hypothetical protein